MAILETRGDLSEEAREARLEELLEDFRIGHVRNSLGLSLSGGERRRVEIARRWRPTRGSSCWMNPLPV